MLLDLTLSDLEGQNQDRINNINNITWGGGGACIKSGLTVVIHGWLSYLDKDFPRLSYMLREISVQHAFSLSFTKKIVKKYISHINSKNLWTVLIIFHERYP